MNCETRIVRKILVESIISECFWKEIASVAVHTLTYHHYEFLLPSTWKTLIIQSKGKGKFVPVRFMKACRGNSQRWVIGFTPPPPWPLSSRERFSFSHSVGGSMGHQGWSRCFGERENLLPVPWNEPRFLSFPVYDFVAVLITLSWIPVQSMCWLKFEPGNFHYNPNKFLRV